MTAGDGEHPVAEGGSLSWLESPQPYTVSPDPSGIGIIIVCREDHLDAVITEPPVPKDLMIAVRRRLTLRAAAGIDLRSDCRLFLVGGDSAPMHSDIEPAFAGVYCLTRSSAPRRHRHELIAPAGHLVSIDSGDWHLDAHPRTVDGERELSLRVDNEERSLRVSSAASVDYLSSSGYHEFDLFGDLSPRSVRVQTGTATLRQPIRDSQVRGGGKLRTLGEVNNCHIDMDGSFEAHVEVADTNIILGGDFEAAGPVRLGNHQLKCRNATLQTDLLCDGIVSCEKLEVHGDITSTGLVMARELRCGGTLHATQLAVHGSIEAG